MAKTANVGFYNKDQKNNLRAEKIRALREFDDQLISVLKQPVNKLYAFIAPLKLRSLFRLRSTFFWCHLPLKRLTQQTIATHLQSTAL